MKAISIRYKYTKLIVHELTVNHLKNKYQEDQTTKAIQYFLDFYYGNHMTNSQRKFDYHF